MIFPFKLPARYEPECERIDGGQGYVYICTDRFLNRRVAIKVMKSKAQSEILLKEIKHIGKVRSPHVVELYDIVKSKENTGLVQEYVPGADLSEASNKLSQNDYLHTIWQVSKGLSDIHASGVIHRDIKPSNIRYDEENVIKILDFGIATDGDEDETVLCRGSMYYRAPELFNTPPIKISSAVDVYAFGILCWHLANKGVLSKAMMEQPPASRYAMPSFEQADYQLSKELIAALDRTLSKKPSDRPAMSSLTFLIEREILKSRHRASLYYQNRTHILSEAGQRVALKSGLDAISIFYDGYRFTVTSAEGDVYINNQLAVPEMLIPGSCVITVGHPNKGAGRIFVPVNMSHPEVIV